MAVKHGMGTTHVLPNNGDLGKISKEQCDGEWQFRQTGLENPNFADYATLGGAVGIRVEDAAALPEARAYLTLWQ